MPALCDGANVNYARHFALLACAAALLAAASRWRFALGIEASFALYGSVHAGALTVSCPTARAPWRRISFIAAAALLSMLTARLGLSLLRFTGRLPGRAGPLAVLAASAAVGALLYGALIRLFRLYPLRVRTLGATALVCALATLAECLIQVHHQAPSGLWLAIPWWFAFSASLWYHHRRPTG